MRGFSRDALITALVLAVVALMASACSSKEVQKRQKRQKVLRFTEMKEEPLMRSPSLE